MSEKTRGCIGSHLVARQALKYVLKSPGLAANIKTAIVPLAQRGCLPIPPAEWLIQHGGLLHA